MIQSKDIQLVDIKEIKVNPKNRNKHTEDQIERLIKIIEYQGFRAPLLVSNRTGMLVAGHGRLIAAKKLKLKQVPVMFQDFVDENQEYAAMVSDNAIASWSELDLSGINMDIGDLGPDFDIDLLGIRGFGIDPSDEEFPELSGNDPDFQTRSFILSNEQSDIVDEALKKAKKEEDCADDLNKNSNGNALTAALKRYVHG